MDDGKYANILDQKMLNEAKKGIGRIRTFETCI
jgi:hypothetical protein